jgi:hypothetical protein
MTEKDDSKKPIPTFDHDIFRRRVPGQDKGEERSRKDSDTMVSNTYRPPPPPPVKKSD